MTYKDKYHALIIAIKCELDFQKKMIDEIETKLNDRDEQNPTLHDAVEIGMKSEKKAFVSTMERWTINADELFVR